MRELGGGTLFSPERRKVSLKVNGKDDSNEARKRLSNGEYSTGYASTKPNGFSNGSLPRLKNGSSIHHGNGTGNGASKHHSSNEHSVDHAVTKDVSAENENSSKRKLEDVVLPQWGHGKRSRCSRFESSKHASFAVEESASKSAPSSEKKSLPNGLPGSVSKLRGHVPSKSISNKNVKDDPSYPRNGLVNRTPNGFVHRDNGFHNDSLKRSSEMKDRSLSKDRVSPQHNKASLDRPSLRQHQRNDGSETATTTNGHSHVHPNGNATENHSRSGNCVSSSNTNTGAGHNKTGGIGGSNNKPAINLQTLEWPKIVIALTRKEKEDDFLIFKGTKLPQRPKKRPKVVEKTLLFCTPGNWLSDLTRGRYDVREKKSTKKKPRGLKAMESMESDSE